MDLSYGKHKIAIDGEWYLDDLYVFPRTYEQVYFLLYSLLPHDDGHINERIQRAYSAFPWQGGYSAVNFYNQLKYTTPREERPHIISMRYASPGYIELGLIVSVAVAVAKLVKAIASAIRETNSAYHEVYTGLQKRKPLGYNAVPDKAPQRRGKGGSLGRKRNAGPNRRGRDQGRGRVVRRSDVLLRALDNPGPGPGNGPWPSSASRTGRSIWPAWKAGRPGS